MVAERIFTQVYDHLLNESVNRAKLTPVLIDCTFNGNRHQKKPDKNDLELLEKIEQLPLDCNVPVAKLPDGYNTKQPRESHGVEYVHQFYSPRNLRVISSFYKHIFESDY